MEKQVLEKVCAAVYEQYPLLKGIIPEIKLQPNGNQVLIFQSSQNISKQKVIPISVRVIVDGNGKIKKLSSSR